MRRGNGRISERVVRARLLTGTVMLGAGSSP